MAAQDWNFALLDDEYNQLNGGMWAGLNGFANADDLGEHWSSDTWNEPFSDHAAHAAPSSAQRPTDHTSNAPAPFSSPPRHVNNEQLRFDPLSDAINYHNVFREQPRDHHPTVAADTSYRRPSQDLPIPHPYQLAAFNPPAPLPQSLPEQPVHNPTPQQQEAHEADYQAVETDSEDDAVMPRNRPAIPVADSPVDLSQSPNMATASQQSRTRKRSSTSNGGDSGSAKKRTKRTSVSTARVDVEDLQDEAPSAEDELLQAQQREALKMQEANKDEGAVKIGQRTCIICLENYTNATTAVCGHIFCHECLTRALMASEKNSDRGKGNCPACRKAINRRNAKEVIPISFLKKSAFKSKGRQAHNR